MNLRVAMIAGGVIICAVLVALPQWIQLNRTRTELARQSHASCVRSRTFEAFVRNNAAARQRDSVAALQAAAYWRGLSHAISLNHTVRLFLLSDVRLRRKQIEQNAKLTAYWLKLATIINGATTCKPSQVVVLPSP